MDRIITPFGATSTASEVLAGVDLRGRRAIVTGASSGIGVETARALAEAGASVTLAVRDAAAGQRAAADIGNDTEVGLLDLVDPASIDAFVARWEGPLHVLVNNAGVMALPEARTPAGWELQFATNHLGHFRLALGLHGAMAAAGNARIVVVSSAGHQRTPVIFDDINFRRRPYDPFLAYGQSKTANVLFAVEAARRWAADGIMANALMPGAIRTPGVDKLVLSAEQIAALEAARRQGPPMVWRTPQQGAATSALLAGSPLVAGVSGRYFEDCQEALPHVPGTSAGVAAYALDPEAAKRLWQLSLEAMAAVR